MRLRSADDLRTVYRPPRGAPVDKVIDHLDRHCVEWLARSPFFVLATADADGVCDASPRGGPPGFVKVVDERHVAWADLSGNNRLDSFGNVVDNDHVAMLVMIPGLDETLRINGRAELVTDAETCDLVAVDGRTPRVAVVVTVTEAYLHCAKALRRAGLWSPDSWTAAVDLPSAACMIKDHASIEADVTIIEAARRRDLDDTLWQPGGG